MKIGRNELLRLTVLLAACTPAQESAPIHVPVQPAQVPVASAKPQTLEPAKPAPVEAPDEPDPTDPPNCSNQTGAALAKICLKVSPTCEGLRDECTSLSDDLRPRVAEKWATCFAKAGKDCRDDKLGACMREAAMAACIEPGTIKQCRAIRRACRQAGKPVEYTLDQCVRVLSAVKPGHTPGDWESVDIERLGPGQGGEGDESGCSLAYVLPYQPFGNSWN